MISKIIKLIPSSIIVYLWKRVPFPQWFRNFIVWHANNRFLVAVLGIVQNDKNQILLLKHTYRPEPWGVPSGWIEYEEPFHALEREVFEESGFIIKAEQVIYVRHIPNPHRIDLIIKGKFIKGSFKPSAEVSDFGFFDIDTLPKGMSEKQKLFVKDALEKYNRMGEGGLD